MPVKKRTSIEVAAPVYKRILAFIIDLIVLEFVVIYPFRKVLISIIPDASITQTTSLLQSNPGITQTIYLTMFAIGVLMIAYFTILEFKLQQTIGKMLLNIYVAGKPTFIQCLVRNLFLMPLFPFFILWITEPLFMLLNKEHQRLLEILSKTKVVSK